MCYRRGKITKGCQRANADSRDKSTNQEGSSTAATLQRLPANVSADTFCNAAATSKEGSGSLDVATGPLVMVGTRAAKIIKFAYDELSELAVSEQGRFPNAVRLLKAIKRASTKVTIEVVTIAGSHPEVAFVVALAAVLFFYSLPQATEVK